MRTKVILYNLMMLCVISCSKPDKTLELENAELTLKIYQDSIQKLWSKLDSVQIKIPSTQNELNQKLEKKEKLKASNDRMEWLCKYATNKEAPARFIMNIPETRFMKIDLDGSYSIKSYDGFHSEKLTSFLTGNLKDLNPKSVRIQYSQEGYMFIQINCIDSDCVVGNGYNERNYSTVSFGPYQSNYIPDFPNKLKKAFEDVIFSLNNYSEIY